MEFKKLRSIAWYQEFGAHLRDKTTYDNGRKV